MSTTPKANVNIKSLSRKLVSASTGPRSAKGKAKSSKNAVSHGLTGNVVMPDEAKMVQEFTFELNEYYKPESPLEVLQIQRIAFCRAKLAKLIDIETAGRQVERKMIELNPERVMNMLPQFSVQIRNLALKALKGQSLLAILGIDAVMLQKISLEIEDFGKMICAPDDLSRYLPTLCDFLGSERFLQINSLNLTLDQRLMIFVQRIQNFFEPEVKLEDKGGYEQMLKRVQLVDDESEYQSQQGLIRNYPSGLHAYRDSVLRDLHQIIELLDVQSEIKTLMQSFEEMKSWMIRAADLQTEQGERMMKYQVMLERRLSSAIGELLEIRKHRFL